MGGFDYEDFDSSKTKVKLNYKHTFSSYCQETQSVSFIKIN